MEINTFTITIQKCLLPTTAHLFLCKYSSPVRAQIGRKHSSFSTIFYNARDHATSLQHNEPWAPLTMSLELHLQWALSSSYHEPWAPLTMSLELHLQWALSSTYNEPWAPLTMSLELPCNATAYQRPCNVSATYNNTPETMQRLCNSMSLKLQDLYKIFPLN